ncbi:transcription factor Adf-1 [Aethina tumida]|uniref:transcription factor Adf-1 n=1 Tax=Aethina tumida TaxID=116153 RepID=UPI00096B5A7E|nr:transcription factor Adf-1 [Aethina tumida]
MKELKMEADILLVKMVEKNPCLYNKKKSEYRDDDLKEMIWSTIASALQTQVSEVKRRWRNLREHYVRELRTSDKTDKPEWPMSTRMQFLNPHIIRRQQFNPLRINTIEYVNDASEPKMEFVEHELDDEEDTKDGSIHREDVPKVEEKVAAPPRKRQRLNDSNNFNPEVEADSPEALFGKLVGSLLANIQSKKKRSSVMVKIMQILEQSDSDDELL